MAIQSTKTKMAKQEADSGLVRLGLALSNWSEKWFPDPLVFAFAGIVVVFIIGLLLHEPASKLAIQGGKNFWTLVPFTMQMVMIIIGGYVVATTPVVNRLIQWLSKIPKTGRGAIAMIALFSMLTSLISWGLSLIFSGLLTRECAQRVKGMDYRAAGAAGYLGTGAVWALGLSSSAAMMMATKQSIPPALFAISGLIPLSQTLFLWQSMLTARDPDRRLGRRRLLVGALPRKSKDSRRLRYCLRTAGPPPGAADQAGRMARIQPAA